MHNAVTQIVMVTDITHDLVAKVLIRFHNLTNNHN